MKNSIDLKEIHNPRCHKECNKEKRKITTTDDLCNQTVSELDGLPVRCVGEWAMEKIYHLIQYFGIFATGMKYKWDGKINYIEICSGPGRCINRSHGTEFNGTSLCVIDHPAMQYLNKALFFDYNQKVVDSLNHRILEKKIDNAKAIKGDYNNPKEICSSIKDEIKNNGLNLVFIDPTDCGLPFELIKELKHSLSNVDLIINIALGTDYNRNIKKVILDPVTYAESLKKYSRFIDNDTFFTSDKVKGLALKNDNLQLRLLLREEYVNSLKKIGYNHFDFKHIRNFYDLIFATSHIKGIEFWEKANKIKHDGQRSLNF